MRAGNIADLRLAGYTIKTIAAHIGMSRERTSQLNREGRTILSLAALGVLRSIRENQS